MRPAKRTTKIKEYFFSRKLEEIKHLNQNGHSIINLGIGNPDLPPHESLKGVMQDALSEEGCFRYKPYKGIDELRKAMVKWYQEKYKVELDFSCEILPLMGSKEGIAHISLAYLEEGDKVLIPDPGYPAYSSAAEIVGAQPVYYKLEEKNNWYPQIEELERLADDKTKVMWINYPHMPTGQQASYDVFAGLIQFASRRKLLLCNDNPYSFILNNNATSLLSVPGAKESVIELNSLSKSHSLAGARIGMLAGKKEIVENVFKIVSNFSSGMFGPLQKMGIAALYLEKAWYEELNQHYLSRKTIVFKIFELLDCKFSKDQSGLFLWGRIPDYISSGDLYSEMILRNAEIFITPGSVFGENGKRYLRISLCSPTEELHEAIERIKTFLHLKKIMFQNGMAQI